MARITWTSKARDDLHSIYEFIAKDAPARAAHQVERLYDSVDRLAEYPSSGRVVPEFQTQTLREIIIDGYRVIYRHTDSTVSVLTIVHGREDFHKIVDVEFSE